MGTFSALLAICAGNSPVPGEFPTQRPVTRSFDIFFICARINGWVNNGEAGDLRRNHAHYAHYDVTVMHWVSDLSVFPCTTMYWYWYWYCVLNPYGDSEYGHNCLRRWYAFAIIGPVIGLSRGRCPDITLTNVNLLSITPLRTNFDEICIKNMQLKMQSSTRRPFWSDQKYQWLWPNGYFTMTSSNGNIFRVTDPLCGEFTGPGEFPTQRPVTRSFDVFFDLRLDKRLSKQPWGWWFETPSWSLWRQCDVEIWYITVSL